MIARLGISILRREDAREDTVITSKKTLERNESVAEHVNDLYRIEKTYTLNENVEFYLMKRKIGG